MEALSFFVCTTNRVTIGVMSWQCKGSGAKNYMRRLRPGIGASCLCLRYICITLPESISLYRLRPSTGFATNRTARPYLIQTDTQCNIKIRH